MSDIDPVFFLRMVVWLSVFLGLPLLAVCLLARFRPSAIGRALIALGSLRVGERLANFRDRKLPDDDWSDA